MKKLLILFSMLSLCTACAACSPASETTTSPGGGDQVDPPADDETTSEGEERCLVVCCSRTGNTRFVAEQIRTALDGDLLEVQPVEPYEEDYNAMLARAREELAAIDQGIYPAIEPSFDRLDEYETVLIGYPIWYGSMATPMQSFLHEHAAQLAGMRVAIFATSGSSGIISSVREAEALCPEADIFEQTLLLTSSSMPQSESLVAEWLEQLNLKAENSGDNGQDDNMKNNTIQLRAGDRTFTATLEQNSSAEALKARLAAGDLQVRMDDYGDMEKVGSLGFTLPRNDEQMNTAPGDLILYQGSSLVIYYDENSWSLTRLGRVDGVSSREEMLELLGGKGSIDLTLSLE